MASSHATVAKRYSRALWLLVGRVEDAESWVEQLKGLGQTISSSTDLQALVSSPSFNYEQKSRVIRSLMEGAKTPETLANFLLTVLKAGRFAALPEITEAFQTKILESKNTLEAVVETAFKMSESSERKLADHLEKLLGKKLSLSVKVIPDLVAGLRVKVGGKTLDFSFTSQLTRLERWLAAGQA